MDPFTKYRVSAILDGYIALKVPGSVRTSVRLQYVWEAGGVSLFEERPRVFESGWSRLPIARFLRRAGQWHVEAPDADGQWIAADLAPDADFESQLEQVELDAKSLFWPQPAVKHDVKS